MVMYPDFYRLQRAPFHSTPDPTCLFLSPSHKAALGAIAHGIDTRQGFVAITGDVGLGKTTIVRSYLARVDARQLKTLFLWNAHVSFGELLTLLCRVFAVRAEPDDPCKMVRRLQQLCMQEYHQGRNVALIIDEAQHLPRGTLEQLRRLTNLEGVREQPLQLVLVGQPELEQTLQQSALGPLAQRIGIHTKLVPLTAEESLAYIRHRIARVALSGGPIFTPEALQHIVRHARGVPRVLNTLCTNALLAGCAAQQQPITAALVKRVIAECTGRRPRSWRRLALATAGGLGLAAGLLWFALVSPVAQATRSAPAARAHPLPEAPLPASTLPRIPPPQEPPPVLPMPHAILPPRVSTTPRVASLATGTAPPRAATGITSPRPGATVGQTIAVEGLLTDLPSDQQVFLCVQSQAFGRLIYPQGKVIPDSTGHWTVKSVYATTGYRYATFLVRTTSPAAAALLSASHARKYGLRALPSGTERLGPAIVVTRQ
jgi:general secretion pathway protein A